MKIEEYGVDAGSYLIRAREELKSGSRSRLFYAAYELRCCIEARQDRYIEAQANYLHATPKRSEIAKKKKLLNALSSSEKVQEVRLSSSKSAKTFYYVPICGELSKARDQLGDYLHAQKHRSLDDPDWLVVRSYLERVLTLASVTCAGRLASPLLYYASRKISGQAIDVVIDGPTDWMKDLFAVAGAELTISIKYHPFADFLIQAAPRTLFQETA